MAGTQKKKKRTSKRKKEIAAQDSPKMPNSLKEAISNILETRTKEANLKHSLNLQRARNLVAGEKRSVGRPKKEPLEKEKPRTIRASNKTC